MPCLVKFSPSASLLPRFRLRLLILLNLLCCCGIASSQTSTFTRTPTHLLVEAANAPANLHLRSEIPGAEVTAHLIRIPLSPVELATIHEAPEVGAETRQLKALEERSSSHTCGLTLEGMGGATYTFLLRENAHGIHVVAQGATLGSLDRGLRVVALTFPAVPAYVTKDIRFSW